MHYAIGLEYVSMKKYRQGIAKFEDLIRRDAHYVPAYHQLGLLFVHLHKKHEAISILEQGIVEASGAGDQQSRAAMEEILRDLRKPFRMGGL